MIDVAGMNPLGTILASLFLWIITKGIIFPRQGLSPWHQISKSKKQIRIRILRAHAIDA
jgi:hypothetical protein